MKMTLAYARPLIAVAVIGLALAGYASNGFAQEGDAKNQEEYKPIVPEKKIARAIEIVEAQMTAPAEKRVSAKLLDNAQCVVLIPDMFQGGIGVGFKHGNGVISCRHDAEKTWGAPAFVRLSGASVGAQLGVQAMDVMVLAMTDNGLNQLLAGKPVASGEAGVSVGPIGRNAEIALDVLLQTPLLSYTRSKGLYAGATLGGSLFTQATNIKQEIYGDFEDIRSLLLERTTVPALMQPLVDTLNKYAPFSQ
jgi:lipid-binding SYLF domain-containing protein